MKRDLLLLTAVVALVLGGVAIAFADMDAGPDGDHDWRGHEFGLEHIAKVLKLTPEQQGKVQPIVEQTRPQIMAIHREAMQKTHGVVNEAMSQIRPLLTP